jgi:hypothetical protein
VPAGPVMRTLTGPMPGSIFSSNFKNGQHSRSAIINSATRAIDFLSPGRRNEYPSFSSSLSIKAAPELSKECCFPIPQLLIRQTTRHRNFIRHIQSRSYNHRRAIGPAHIVSCSIARIRTESSSAASRDLKPRLALFNLSFRPQNHALFLGHALIAGTRGCFTDGLVFVCNHRRLEAPDARPIPLPSSGSFLGPKTSSAIPKTSNKCIG